MKAVIRTSALLAAAATALALGPAGAASAQARLDVGQPPSVARHAVFVETDNPAGNQILVFAEHQDGRLSERAVVSTGGLGGLASGAKADELASQGGVAYDGTHRLLFAVNAGSDSLSVFSARGRDVNLLQVVPSGGSFPSSVAVSGNLVYVLDAGGTGTVAGFRIVGRHLVPLADGTRSLDLANTAPPNFLASPGQVGFSPDGSQLVVTTKASTSSIDVFEVARDGSLSVTPTITADTGNVPFAFVFTPSGQLAVTDAADSSLHTYSLASGGTLTSLGTLGDGQKAACWVATAGGYYYLANAGSSTISGYTVSPSGTPALVGSTGIVGSTDAGAIDLAASTDGSTLYVEAGVAGAVDEYHVNADGSLNPLGSVAGIGAGIEGIATD